MEFENSQTKEKSSFRTKDKDEPISETEFKLLYVDLTQDLDENDSIVDYSGEKTIQTNDKPLPTRGRGRPKGSKNKTYKHKTGKKQSQQGGSYHPKHNDFVLPDRLKKRVKTESDIIIDLTKRSVAPVTETSFDLKDKVDLKTWKLLDRKGIKCTLCCKPGNFAVLGPLYGPYKILVDRTNHDGKEIRGQKAEKTLNVRLHKDCAIWAPGLCFVGSDLIGTGRMLSNASKKVFIKRIE